MTTRSPHSASFLQVLLLAAAAAAAVASEPAVDAALRTASELGLANGQALACHADAAAKQARQLMLLHVPKTERFGEAYEKSTQEGFVTQLHSKSACPTQSQLLARIDTITATMPTEPVTAAQAGDAGAPVNSRYLLVDARGRIITNEDFPGRLQLIAFGYTACPDICPTSLARMAQALQLLGEQGASVQPIFISVDPQRDSAATLAEYTTRFDERILGLTGTPELIAAVVEHFGLRVVRRGTAGAVPVDYAVDHSSGFYLLDGEGAFVARLAEAASPQELAARARDMLATGVRH